MDNLKTVAVPTLEAIHEWQDSLARPKYFNR